MAFVWQNKPASVRLIESYGVLANWLLNLNSDRLIKQNKCIGTFVFQETWRLCARTSRRRRRWRRGRAWWLSWLVLSAWATSWDQVRNQPYNHVSYISSSVWKNKWLSVTVKKIFSFQFFNNCITFCFAKHSCQPATILFRHNMDFLPSDTYIFQKIAYKPCSLHQ